jgi:hypothetical protein
MTLRTGTSSGSEACRRPRELRECLSERRVSGRLERDLGSERSESAIERKSSTCIRRDCGSERNDHDRDHDLVLDTTSSPPSSASSAGAAPGAPPPVLRFGHVADRGRGRGAGYRRGRLPIGRGGLRRLRPGCVRRRGRAMRPRRSLLRERRSRRHCCKSTWGTRVRSACLRAESASAPSTAAPWRSTRSTWTRRREVSPPAAAPARRSFLRAAAAADATPTTNAWPMPPRMPPAPNRTCSPIVPPA